jgi:hypothetical protein
MYGQLSVRCSRRNGAGPCSGTAKDASTRLSTSSEQWRPMAPMAERLQSHTQLLCPLGGNAVRAQGIFEAFGEGMRKVAADRR